MRLRITNEKGDTIQEFEGKNEIEVIVQMMQYLQIHLYEAVFEGGIQDRPGRLWSKVVK